MDFFESQDRAKRKSGLLLGLYLLAIAAIIVAVYAVIIFAFTFVEFDPRIGDSHREVGWLQYWDPPLFACVAGGILLLVVSGSVYRILQLRGDGGRVARLLGGTPVTPSTDDPAARRLVNVVEEMAIASGMPVPQIFILEEERGINAFAAGDSPDNAAVAVTRNAIETLDRDELQGVIAHEFSHILNGDMRLNMRLMGLLNGILIIHLLGMVVMRGFFYGGTSQRRRYGGGSVAMSGGGRGSGRGRGGGGGGIIIALIIVSVALTIIGYIGVIFARLIQSAVSRQREYLADAAAVQYTRNPAGITGALKKIGGLAYKGQVRSAHSVEAGHFFFANAMSRTSANLFATHPPLGKRIRAVDPSFDGKFPVIKPPRSREPVQPQTQAAQTSARGSASGGGVPFPGGHAFPGGSAFPGGNALPVRLDVLMASIGTLGAAHRHRAAKLLEELPGAIREAAREPLGAKAVVYLLLLSKDEKVREQQRSLLEEKADPRVPAELRKLRPEMENLKPEGRLPLLDLSLPALRDLSPEQYEAFQQVVRDLIAADDKVSVFEFCLEKLLFRHLDEHFGKTKARIAQFHSFRAVADEISVLLSALAHAGEKNTRKAFDAGLSQIAMLRDSVRLHPEDSCTTDAIGAALDRLAATSPPMKKRFLRAASLCVASDGELAVEEGELLRAFAEALGCPMPPILGGETAGTPPAGPAE